jgi:hypothetical protein
VKREEEEEEREEEKKRRKRRKSQSSTISFAVQMRCKKSRPAGNSPTPRE